MIKEKYREILDALANRNMAVILLLSFSSGLPLALSTGTLQAWLATTDVDIQTVALFSLVGLPYTFKFIWAPIMDRFIPPFLGRRRGWMLLTQIILIVLILSIAFTDPENKIMLIGMLALLLAFFSASQDIAIDAYRADLLKPKERGFGAAVTVSAYRTAMLVSGGLAWIVADNMGWQFTYCLMAALMSIGLVGTIWGPEPTWDKQAPVSLQDAVILPFKEFAIRRHGILLLVFIVIYKLGDASAISLNSLFFIREQGFTLTETGVLYKWLGITATIIGAFIGGTFVVTHGIYKPLLWFGILQAITNLGFMMLAIIGKSYIGMVVVIAVDQLVGGMGTAVFLGFLIALCNHQFTATQFALLSALSSIGRVFIGPPAGYMIEHIGWALFFLVTFLIAIPSLVLLIYMRPTIESYHNTEK
jgi:PAT family beta-lactamase induction signal transducer AmpG